MSPAGDGGAAGMEPFMGSPAAPIDMTPVDELPVTLEQIAELTGYADAGGFVLVVLRKDHQDDVITDGPPAVVAECLSDLARSIRTGLAALQ